MPPRPSTTPKRKQWAKPLTHADVQRLKHARKKVFASSVSLASKRNPSKTPLLQRKSKVPTKTKPSVRVKSAPKSKAGTAKKSHRVAPSKTAIAKKPATKKTARTLQPKKSEVYVLQLEGGYVYVGKTSCGIKRRLAQHMGTSSLKGAAFTRLHRPTGKLLKRIGNLEGDGDGPERDETLRQMYRRGVQRVRGWKYVRAAALRQDDLDDIECNIRELFDLCRKCGRAGHFAAGCREAKDRRGRALRAAVVSVFK